MIDWISVLVFPLCGLLAALGAGLWLRGQDADDGQIYWSFTAVFVLAIVVCASLLRTDSLQRRLDPMVDAALQLDAHPLFAALRESQLEQSEQLLGRILQQVAEGRDLVAATASVRPDLARIGNAELGWADAETRVQWARAEVATLRELSARNATQCAAVARSQADPAGLEVLATGMTVANQQQFEAAFVRLLKSRPDGLSGRRTNDGIDFNDAQRRYIEIHASLASTHGEDIDDDLGSRHLDRAPPKVNDPNRVCRYRIAQLEAYLAEPAPMASRLVDAAMR